MFNIKSKEYMEKLIKSFNHKFLLNNNENLNTFVKEVYIDLIGYILDNNGKKISEFNPIDKIIKKFFVNKEKNFLLIFGESQTGKTTLSEYIAYKLSTQKLNYKEDNNNPFYIRNLNHWTPIILPLKFTKSMKLEVFIESSLKENCGIITTYSEFSKKFINGEFIIILDSSSEMSEFIDFDTKLNVFNEINKLIKIGNKSKVILTCNDTYFKSIHSKKEILEILEPNIYNILNITKFNNKQIKNFITSNTDNPSFYLKQLENNLEFKNLVIKPELLRLVIKYLPDLIIEKTKKLKLCDLYLKTIQSEFKLNFDIQPTDIKDNKYYKFLKKISLWLFIENSLYLDMNKLFDELEFTEFFEINDEKINIFEYLNNISKLSFFEKKSNNIYCFKNKSFIEYLVSLDLVWEINENKPDLINKIFTNSKINKFIVEQNPNKKHLVNFIKNSDSLGSKASNAISILNILEDGYLNQILDVNQLTKKNFAKANLEGVNFIEANLKDSNFTEADLTRANLEGANLEGANLEGAGLENTDFTEADLTGAIIIGANFNDAHLLSANFSYTHLESSTFMGARISGANFSGATLKEANFKYSTLEGVTFNSSNMKKTNFENANLLGARLIGVNLEGAIFKKANLECSILDNSILNNANFEEANLESAVLDDVILENANLKNTNFITASLITANLKGAIIENTNFKGAILFGTKFDYLENLDKVVSFKGSLYCFDSENEKFITTFPKYFDPKYHKMIEYKHSKEKGFWSIKP